MIKKNTKKKIKKSKNYLLKKNNFKKLTIKLINLKKLNNVIIFLKDLKSNLNIMLDDCILILILKKLMILKIYL